MDFRYSTEHDDFRASLRGFLRDRTPQLRSADGHDDRLWRNLCSELELPGLHVPPEYGGAGAGLIETAIAFCELGRVLAPVPYASNTFATEAILRLGDEEQRRALLPGLLTGEQVAAFAPVGQEVVEVGGDGRLTGACSPVLHGHVADLFIVPASRAGDVSLYAVRAAAPGVCIERLPSFDLTRPVARVRFSEAPGEALVAGGPEALDQVLDVARVLLAAEMLGGAEACLDMAVDYACHRMQFDRPIGSFQAVKHACADMLIEIDATRAAVMFAAMSATTGDELHLAAPLVKAQAADTFVQCAGAAIQIHGGIAFTWEHDLHLYFRRATTSAALFGSSAQHRALLADRAGL
ncbi:acyl-CoA dehydrogenase family protein [Mycobacterium camsae]|uniref:acyl-CoA dehydrogenase family protein n=1 Tax=Mycobacterium gordonae TaxID=1778 RepID=UPI00197DB978|nr:acyl-CoA dehydrogenase family protein [Mycobacterium gordonae]